MGGLYSTNKLEETPSVQFSDENEPLTCPAPELFSDTHNIQTHESDDNTSIHADLNDRINTGSANEASSTPNPSQRHTLQASYTQSDSPLFVNTPSTVVHSSQQYVPNSSFPAPTVSTCTMQSHTSEVMYTPNRTVIPPTPAGIMTDNVFRYPPSTQQGQQCVTHTEPRQNIGSCNPTQGQSHQSVQMKPQMFNGNDWDVTNYFIHFETVCNWNGFDSSQRAQMLIMRLTGDAQKVISTLTSEQRLDYEKMKSVLMQRYNPYVQSQDGSITSESDSDEHVCSHPYSD